MEDRVKYGNAAIRASLAWRNENPKDFTKETIARAIADIFHAAQAIGIEPLYVASLAVISWQEERDVRPAELVEDIKH